MFGNQLWLLSGMRIPRSAMFLLLALNLGWPMASEACPQETAPPTAIQRIQRMFPGPSQSNAPPAVGLTLDDKGNFEQEALPGRMREVLLGMNQLSCLTPSEVNDELDLVGFQREELAALSKRTEALMDDWVKLFVRETERLQPGRLENLSDAERAELEAILRPLDDEGKAIQAELAKVLLPHQRKTLDRFSRRFELLRKGAASTLDSLLVGELSLAPADRNRLRETLTERAGELAESIQKTLHRQSGEVLKLLDENQKQILEDVAGSMDGLSLPSFELAALQLKQVPEQQTSDGDLLDEWRSVMVYWEITPEGGLRGVTNVLPWAPHNLLMLAASERYGPMDSWGEMTLDWARENLETWLPREDINEGMNEVMQAFQRGELTRQQVQEMMQQRSGEFMQKRLRECVRVLTPAQSNQLETVLIRRLIASRGLHSSLVDGKLGRRLSLSNEQATALRELAKKHLEEVVNESQAWERKVWDWIVEGLSPEQGKLVREEIAVKLEQLPGAPSLLLSAFVR